MEEVGDELRRKGEGVVGHVRKTDDEIHDLLDLRVEIGYGHAACGAACFDKPFDVALRVADAAEFDVGGDFKLLAGWVVQETGKGFPCRRDSAVHPLRMFAGNASTRPS